MNEEIAVVSGLPRSGTSLAMQMLAAGGIEPLTDGQRRADEDNPRGYYELEAVKRLKQDNSWTPEARGKAVKVISHLLPDLPSRERYRILFVERDLEEILVSQERMLERLGRPAAPRETLRKAFGAHLEGFERAVAARPEMAVLRIAYQDIIAEPTVAAERIAQFYQRSDGQKLDVAAMAIAVDPTLYRNRNA